MIPESLNRRFLPLAVAVLGLLAICHSLPAQDAGGVVVPANSTLDTVVVTATREALAVSDTPNSVTVIDAEDIIRRLGRSLPELLNETPSVMVQKTAHGQGSPFIRGFTGYRNLALIDGVRLNNAVFRDGPNQYWNTIDPYSVRSIELVKGQGSVLYGSDAIGGTLNVLTARPLYAESGSLASGRKYGRFSSAEDSYTGRLEATASEADRYGFILGVTGKDYGDLRTADQGRNRNSGYDEWNFDTKTEIFLNEDTRLTILHQQTHQNDAWRTHSTIYGLSFRGTTVGDDQRRSLDQGRYLTYIQLEGTTGGFVDHYLVGVSHQRQSEEQCRLRKVGDDRSDIQGFDVDSYGAMAQFSSDTNLGYLTYGASYYQDRVDSFRDNFDSGGSFAGSAIQGPVPDDSRYHLADAFVQDRIELGERLDVWLGGRFTYARAEIGRGEDPVTGNPFAFADDWTHGVGSGRFVYELDEDGTVALFGGVSQGFRAPNLSDLSRLDLARTGEIETPSPGLAPEQFISFELGLRGAVGDTRASLAFYHTDIRDLIVGSRTGRIVDDAFEVTKLNAGDGHVRGVEFEIEQGLTDQLTLFGWLSWQDGELETKGVTEPLSRIMPFTAEAGVRWSNIDGDLWLELLALGAAKQDDLPLRDQLDTQRIPPGGTPGYVIGTLRGGWEWRAGLTLTAGIENLTDEAYRVHGSGINGAGRNFILGAEWKF
jgi:hemoglobin/transferrin/lactoferrin receptor protein